MNEIRFEWDEAKNRKNRRAHGVSFEEAKTVFLDESAQRFFDPDHSEDEGRRSLAPPLRVLFSGQSQREGHGHQRSSAYTVNASDRFVLIEKSLRTVEFTDNAGQVAQLGGLKDD
jgi:hypothetical protein